MPRQTKFAVLAIAVILAFSSVSLAQYRDDDDRYHQGDRGQACQYGYQQGYRDGYDKGRHEVREKTYQRCSPDE